MLWIFRAALLRERYFRNRLEMYEIINNDIDIQALLKEKEEYKSKYIIEMKQHN